jgi:hypothetical protein
MEKELQYLGHALESPERPFVVILGGAKVSDKIDVITNMLGKVDRLMIGGAMAYTFFKSRGVPIGRSLVEDDKLDEARAIVGGAAARGVPIALPVDHVVTDRVDAGAASEVLDVGDAASTSDGVDIGPEHCLAAAIAGAKTVVWNGPMGVFEIDAIAAGTNAVARAIWRSAVRRSSAAAIRAAVTGERGRPVSHSPAARFAEFLGGSRAAGVAALLHEEDRVPRTTCNPFIAGNWKMAGPSPGGRVREERTAIKDVDRVEIVLAPAFLAVRRRQRHAHRLAPRRISRARRAFTGEVSADGQGSGLEHIVGHRTAAALWRVGRHRQPQAMAALGVDADRRHQRALAERGAT